VAVRHFIFSSFHRTDIVSFGMASDDIRVTALEVGRVSETYAGQWAEEPPLITIILKGDVCKAMLEMKIVKGINI